MQLVSEGFYIEFKNPLFDKQMLTIYIFSDCHLVHP